MARLPRLIVPDQVHHIVQRGHDGLLAFRDADDYLFFLRCLRDAAKRFQVALHAYVLLPDQFQLLATPTDLSGLARMMQWIGRYYVPYVNQRYARSGTLWQGRYKTMVIDAEAYWMLCSRYIEWAPVRAGLAAQPADYRWSSYVHHIGASADAMLSDHALYWALGNTPFEREVAYQRLAGQALNAAQMAVLQAATLKGWALGSSSFIAALEKQGGQRVQAARRGRPRSTSVVDAAPHVSPHLTPDAV